MLDHIAMNGVPFAKVANLTDTTPAALVAAEPGHVHVVTDYRAVNGHASVNTEVQLLSGAATILDRTWCQSLGGGTNGPFRTGKATASGEALNVKAITTGANVLISVAGYTRKVL